MGARMYVFCESTCSSGAPVRSQKIEIGIKKKGGARDIDHLLWLLNVTPAASGHQRAVDFDSLTDQSIRLTLTTQHT